MKKLITLSIAFSFSANAEYFKVAYDKGHPETAKCIRIESGSAEDAVQKTKTNLHSCKNKETIVTDTFSVLCKDKKNNPPSQIFFFSKNEKSCLALLEFQKNGSMQDEFRNSTKTK